MAYNWFKGEQGSSYIQIYIKGCHYLRRLYGDDLSVFIHSKLILLINSNVTKQVWPLPHLLLYFLRRLSNNSCESEGDLDKLGTFMSSSAFFWFTALQYFCFKDHCTSLLLLIQEIGWHYLLIIWLPIRFSFHIDIHYTNQSM